jgi:hypothetical protein
MTAKLSLYLILVGDFGGAADASELFLFRIAHTSPYLLCTSLVLGYSVDL